MLSTNEVPGTVLKYPGQPCGEGTVEYPWKSPGVIGLDTWNTTHSLPLPSKLTLPSQCPHIHCVWAVLKAPATSQPRGMVSVSVGNGGDPAQKQVLWLTDGMGTSVTTCAFSAPSCCFSVSASVRSKITIVHGVKYRFWMKTWAQRKNKWLYIKNCLC